MKKNKDLTNIYKINEKTGEVRYTVKAHGMYFTGKSKVNRDEGDVFDLEKGKQIAKLRAVLKMKHHFLNEALDMQKYVRHIASLEEDITNEVALLTQSVLHVEDLLQEALGTKQE